jgi:hypothetical protein
MKNIADFYPLSPMQQGMLFHSLYAPDSGVYVEQTAYTLRGPLDVEAFVRAWQRVVDRHPVLRTAFMGGGAERAGAGGVPGSNHFARAAGLARAGFRRAASAPGCLASGAAQAGV